MDANAADAWKDFDQGVNQQEAVEEMAPGLLPPKNTRPVSF